MKHMQTVLMLVCGVMSLVITGLVWLLDVASTDVVIGAMLDQPRMVFPAATLWAYIIQTFLSVIQVVYLRGWMTYRHSMHVGGIATFINVVLSFVGGVMFLTTLSWYAFDAIPWMVARTAVQGIVAFVLAATLAFAPEWMVVTAFDLLVSAVRAWQEDPARMPRLAWLSSPRPDARGETMPSRDSGEERPERPVSQRWVHVSAREGGSR